MKKREKKRLALSPPKPDEDSAFHQSAEPQEQPRDDIRNVELDATERVKVNIVLT